MNEKVKEQKQVDYYKISPEKFKVMESKLSILNPETLQYLQVVFSMTIEPVYEESRTDSKK